MNSQEIARIEKIKQMESCLNNASAVLEKYQQMLSQFAEVQSEIRALSEYYGSAEWYRDLEDYDQGKLPTDLKCGVLSEDSIYNLLTDNREIAIEMLETATKILK